MAEGKVLTGAGLRDKWQVKPHFQLLVKVVQA